ncbi:PEP-CTERM sorting domain-containing protein [Aquincola sp. S2]|uniref:PEP-CTERM sorting domain-containing protein n=1 Tax=Pseudaquabacterium terrae TaxID=2732868 RepID=A0ABX2ES58_9BURK|nr:PEP-CTERM sorting domain-containing protein [Aquabacterium terrae]NRF71466.1 PEP-CTERM sorting domain-containing protein [Aquabacterium terrae]
MTRRKTPETRKTLHTLAAALLLAGAAFTLSPTATAAPVYKYTTIDVPGAVQTHVQGVDDSGAVVGAWLDAGGAWHGFRAQSGVVGGVVSTINYPGAAYTDAFGIGSSGAVAGTASSVPQIGSGDPAWGYLLASGAYTALVPPGAVQTGAFGVNGALTVVGSYRTGPPGTGYHGFVWSGGAFTTLDVPGADSTLPVGINDLGQIVGAVEASCTGCAPSSGFLWSAGTLTTITPFGATRSGAFGLNDLGAIVGWYGEGDELSGYLWADGSFVPIEPPATLYAQASDINNAGVIAGTYADAAGVIHGFVATPVPEPGSFVLATLGLGVAAALRRRRTGAPQGVGVALGMRALPGADHA